MRSVDKILLFCNVEINRSKSHLFDNFPIMDWLPIYIELETEDERGKMYYMDLSNIMDYDQKDVGIDKKWLKDFPSLNKPPEDIDILPVLTKLNNIEYEKLDAKINRLVAEHESAKKYDKIVSEVIQERINLFVEFKKEFISWFLDNDLDPLQSKSNGSIEEKSLEPENETVSLPTIPEGTLWQNIKMFVLDDFTIHVVSPNNEFDIRFTQTKNFINKTTKKPNDSWELLLELSLYGDFNPNDHSYKILTKKPGKPKHRVYVCGKALTNEFSSEELEPYDDNQSKFENKLDHSDQGFKEITEHQL